MIILILTYDTNGYYLKDAYTFGFFGITAPVGKAQNGGGYGADKSVNAEADVVTKLGLVSF